MHQAHKRHLQSKMAARNTCTNKRESRMLQTLSHEASHDIPEDTSNQKMALDDVDIVENDADDNFHMRMCKNASISLHTDWISETRQIGERISKPLVQFREGHTVKE